MAGAVKSITVSNGRIMSASGGLIATADMTTTGVTAGSYTSANITVDAAGRITVAANGAGGGGGGTVTSVNLTAPAAGITVSGGPITTFGSITLALADDLAALEALSGTNTIYYRSAANTWAAVAIGTGLTFTGGTLSAQAGGEAVWRFAATSTSMADPGSGKLRGNNAVVSSMSQLAVSNITDNGIDRTNLLRSLASGDSLLIQNQSDATKWARFTLSADPTDNTSWFLLPVTHVDSAGGGITNNDALLITFGIGGSGGGAGGITQLTGDVTAGPGTGSVAATIANNAVNYAKMQTVTTQNRLLGRGNSAPGNPEEITLGSGLTMTGTTLTASGPAGPQGPPGDPGSGVAVVYFQDAPPESPNANDDEFNTGSLNTSVWSEWDVGGVMTPTVGTYGLKLSHSVTTLDSLAGIHRSVPAGDWSITTKVSLAGTGTNYTQGGIFLSEDIVANPSTADIRFFGILYANNNEFQVRVLRCSAYNSFTSNVFNLTTMGHAALYFRIRRISGTYFYDMSSDGLNWMQVYSESAPFTVARMGLCTNNPGSAGKLNTVCYFRFWRQTAITTNDQPLLGRFSATQGEAGPATPGGRLTLTTAVPITTADVLSSATLYYTPYLHNRVDLYDGTRWRTSSFSELSLSLTGLVSASVNYDVFLYDNSGTLTLELVAWSSDTARATALVYQDGRLVKSGATTRLYLGTIRGNGTGICTESVERRFVWNAYNRVRKNFLYQPVGATWSYSGTSWRQANTSSYRVSYVVGLDGVLAYLCVQINATGTSGQIAYASMDEDGIGTPEVSAVGGWDVIPTAAGAAGYAPIVSTRTWFVPLGFHYTQWIEKTSGVSATYIAAEGLGMSGWIEC